MSEDIKTYVFSGGRVTERIPAEERKARTALDTLRFIKLGLAQPTFTEEYVDRRMEEFGATKRMLPVNGIGTLHPHYEVPDDKAPFVKMFLQ